MTSDFTLVTSVAVIALTSVSVQRRLAKYREYVGGNCLGQAGVWVFVSSVSIWDYWWLFVTVQGLRHVCIWLWL